MFDRKVAIIKNKKCYVSSDYVRKIINTYKGRNKLNQITNENNIFKKVESFQNIEQAKEHPLILYNKSKKKDINMENQIKKELIENQGYLNDNALKKNLMNFYSLSLSENKKNNINNKNLFRRPLSYHKKNRKERNKISTNSDFFQSSDSNKWLIQKKYSDSVRKDFMSTSAKKHRKNFIETDNTPLKRKNSMNYIDKNLLSNEKYVKNLVGQKNKKINNTIKDIRLRKKEYLDMNNISYENMDDKEIENEKNNEKEKKRKVKIFENGKYIKFKNNKKVDENKVLVFSEYKKKKSKEKKNVDVLEYINKIRSFKNMK